MLLIAIDPGATGGIATMNTHDGRVVVIKMPDTPKDILELFGGLGCMDGQVKAVMEGISSGVFLHSGQGGAAQKAASMCKLHRHCGHVEMALIATGIPFESVSPQKWQKSMGALPKDLAARKRKIKDLMQRKHPNVKVTLWNADALGILEWAKANA